MKKFIFTIIALLGILMPTSAWAQTTAGDEGSYREAYAVLVQTYAEDGTISDAYITMYYDTKKAEHTEGTVVGLDELASNQALLQARQQLHSVIFDQSFADARPTSTRFWFGYCFELKTISGLEYLNTSEVTDMSEMFIECGMDKIDLSALNTSKVTTMNRMFAMCRGLVGVNLSSFDTSNVTDMEAMFAGCTSLITVIVGDKWSTDKVTSGDYMFNGCTSIVGGNGTTYDENHIDPSYARIDKEGQPGYFTQGSGSGEGQITATPTWAFENEKLVLSCETEGAEIHYAMQNWTTEDEANSICETMDVIAKSVVYTAPIEVTDNIVIKMYALKEGLRTSNDTTFVYDYKSWSQLYDVIRYGVDVAEKAEASGKVEEGLIEELRWALNEGDHMYQMRAEVSNSEAKYFTEAIMEACKKIEEQMNATGSNEIITFADTEVKAICVQNWDTNGDGELSESEAAAVTDLGRVFKNNSTITSFEEFRYFTGVTTIGENEFDACSHLSSIILPTSIKEIGRYGLSSTALPSIMIPAGVTNIHYTALNYGFKNIYVESQNEYYCSIDGVLFSKDSTILVTYPIRRKDSSYTIPETVTTIGACAFYGCDLGTIIIPNSVKRINTGAFRYCSFESIQLPNSVEYIEAENFEYCDNLTTFTIPSSVIYLASSVLACCASLKEIIVESDNQNYASDDGILYSKDLSTLCIYPAGKTEESFTIPDNVSILGQYAFYGCESIKSLFIPISVNSIGSSAFWICTNLAEVTVYWPSPISVSDKLFSTTLKENCTLYVPYGTKSLYETFDVWKDFKNIVEMEAPATTAAFKDCTLTVGGNTTMDAALEQVGGRAEVAKTIAAIVWNSSEPLTKSDLEGLIDNPNLLIFVKDASLAPEGVENVVVDGKAKSIVLIDTDSINNNFYAPQEFTAESISYTREFKQTTQKDVSRGWEGICLPFTVQAYTHEDHGAIAPFRNDASEFHFWLHQMTEDGMAIATDIEANKPYIISMPNNITYPATYNQAGKVTFSAKDVVVPVSTPVMIHLSDGSIGVGGVYNSLPKMEGFYALNVGDDFDGYPEGSVFVNNYRTIRPFEVYSYHASRSAGTRTISLSSLFGGVDGATGILDVMDKQESDEIKVYSINGILLKKGNRSEVMNSLPKGLYIIGNQKIMVK